MKLSGLLIFVLCALVNSSVTASDMKPFGALLDQSLSDVQRVAAVEAGEDFAAVLAFKKPIHATSDGFMFKDGGSLAYNGRGYRIVVCHSFLPLNGRLLFIVYGPEVRFDQKLFPTLATIAQTACYESSDLKERLGKAANKALVPTTPSVTPAADAPVAPAAVAAHL